MDKALHTGMTLIDFQKAFDTLDHDVLLDKMDCKTSHLMVQILSFE